MRTAVAAKARAPHERALQQRPADSEGDGFQDPDRTALPTRVTR
ncbi:hypothetical protein [Streptomyces sp. A5-4]